MKPHYLYDDLGTRYHLASSRGGKALNWLFVPGGPGFDSSYFLPLAQNLNVDGNV